MRTTELLICETCKKYPSLEKEISLLPRMKWFKLIIKDFNCDGESEFTKCPLLTKQYCITILKSCNRLLEKITASPMVMGLWSKYLIVTERLFLRSSKTVREKKFEIVENVKTYCKVYKSNFSKTFVYLHILEFHLEDLINRFHVPSLQNQEIKHEHALFQRLISRKTNNGGGVNSENIKFSPNAQALLVNARMLHCYCSLKQRNSKELKRFLKVRKAKVTTKQANHRHETERSLLQLHKLAKKLAPLQEFRHPPT